MFRVSTHGFGLKPEPRLLRSDLVPVQLSLWQPQVPCLLLRPGCGAGVSERSSPGQGKVPGHIWVSEPSALLLWALQDHRMVWLEGTLKVTQFQTPSYGQGH